MTLNVEPLIPGYINELVIDLERFNRYAFAAYLVSPLRTTIAAHFVRLYQDKKLSFEQCLEFVDIEQGENLKLRLQLTLPAKHWVTAGVVRKLEVMGFRRESDGDKIKLVL